MSKHVTLTKDETKHIADLVKLELTDSELERYSSELTQTLKFIEELEEVNTQSVEPTYQTTGRVNRFQHETVGERTLTPSAALSNAPEKDDGLFKIPGFNYAK